MSDIPHYFLYGETQPGDEAEFLFIASLEESLPKHNWDISPHRHDHLHQLLVLQEGEVLVNVGDWREAVSDPVILSVPAREVHGFAHQPGVKGYIITVSETFLLNNFNEAERRQFATLFSEMALVKLSSDQSGSENTQAQHFEATLTALLDEYHQPKNAQSSMLGAYLKILFVLIWRSAFKSAQRPKQVDGLTDSKLSTYQGFHDLLEQHFNEQWTLQRYADQLGLTTSRLNRLCQHHAGCNALKLIHDRLITEAKRLLIYSSMTASEITYELGFKDPGYFSRFFMRHCGEAPLKFRRRIQRK